MKSQKSKEKSKTVANAKREFRDVRALWNHNFRNGEKITKELIERLRKAIEKLESFGVKNFGPIPEIKKIEEWVAMQGELSHYEQKERLFRPIPDQFLRGPSLGELIQNKSRVPIRQGCQEADQFRQHLFHRHPFTDNVHGQRLFNDGRRHPVGIVIYAYPLFDQTNLFKQVLEVNRFLHEVIRAQFHDLDSGIHTPEGSDHNGPYQRVQFFHMRQHLIAVHIRHLVIQENQLIRVFRKPLSIGSPGSQDA